MKNLKLVILVGILVGLSGCAVTLPPLDPGADKIVIYRACAPNSIDGSIDSCKGSSPDAVEIDQLMAKVASGECKYTLEKGKDSQGRILHSQVNTVMSPFISIAAKPDDKVAWYFANAKNNVNKFKGTHGLLTFSRPSSPGSEHRLSIFTCGLEKIVEQKPKSSATCDVVFKNYEGKWQTATDYKRAWNKDKEGRIYNITKSDNGYNVTITSDEDFPILKSFNLTKEEFLDVTDITVNSSVSFLQNGSLGWTVGASAAKKCGSHNTCKTMQAQMFPGGAVAKFKDCRDEVLVDDECREHDTIFHQSTNKISKADRFFCINDRGEYVNNPNLDKRTNKTFKEMHEKVSTSTFVRVSSIKKEFDGDL
jgi:hypothetical protein